MFTHPALLRKLTTTAEFLRRSGEAGWARTLRSLGDVIRKQGWTEESRQEITGLFEGDKRLSTVSFGAEHERWLHGEKGLKEANERLAGICDQIRELAHTPTIEAPKGDRPRSPDLG